MIDYREKKKRPADLHQENLRKNRENKFDRGDLSRQRRRPLDLSKRSELRMKPSDQLRRRERIERNDGLSRFPSYDNRVALKREKWEIKHNADAWLRTQGGRGLDRPTRKFAEHEKARQIREHRKDR